MRAEDSERRRVSFGSPRRCRADCLFAMDRGPETQTSDGANRPGLDAPAWTRRLHQVIFESDTPAGKAFDTGLLVAVCVSVLVVVLASVKSIQAEHGVLLRNLEWVFTALFTAEYFARLLCVRRPLVYARSFLGLVDLLAVLPSFISLFTGANYVLAVRVLRLLRVFRVLKLAHFLRESEMLTAALLASRRKVMVFVFAVLALATVMGTLMYVVEGEENGFDSIPHSIYWAIVTLTTVGYGDIAPHTALGRFIASCIMLMGYGIIAVPTGIFSLELQQAARARNARSCPHCGTTEPDELARFCRRCGTTLDGK